MTYQHIIFDLDHTLWDFERNSLETLSELFVEYNLAQWDISLQHFTATYSLANRELWHWYNHGKISQEELRAIRFEYVFEKMNVAKTLVPAHLGDAYLERCPQKPYLMPQTLETLTYLKEKKYQLHILTNGFADSQAIKLSKSGIANFFEKVTTACEINCQKPNKALFEYKLGKINAQVGDCLMIGDNAETDILGANSMGMDSVFYNPEKLLSEEKATYEISCLSELKAFL